MTLDSGELLRVLAGVGLLVLTTVAWSGRWRRWAQSPWLRAAPITAVPGLGIFLLVTGISAVLPAGPQNALTAITILVMLGLILLMLADPRWFGPSWYQEVKSAFADGVTADLAVMADDPRRAGESSVEATQRHRAAGRPLPPNRRVNVLKDPKGRLDWAKDNYTLLVFYPQAPLFAIRGHPEENEIIPAESLLEVRKLSDEDSLDIPGGAAGSRSLFASVVRLDTTDGPWLFESRRAKDVVREIRQRYLRTQSQSPRSSDYRGPSATNSGE